VTADAITTAYRTDQVRNGDKQLVYDFDSGVAANDASAKYGEADLGLGDIEAISAPGDSGGPTFIDGLIAGITSYGFEHDSTDSNNDPFDVSFGAVAVDTRVASFAKWIDDMTSKTSLAVDAVSGLKVSTNTRDITVRFNNAPATAAMMRFAINSQQYGPWKGFQESSTLTLPNWYGDNFVNAQLRLGDGRTVDYLYQPVLLVRPELVINHGSNLTNNPAISISFNQLSAGAEKVRFQVNGSAFGEWIDVNEATGTGVVKLPNWQGTNYVTAEVRYENQKTLTLYDSIVYATPKMALDGGAELTSFRSVRVGFSDVASEATRVRFSMNGQEFGEWMTFRPEMSVSLPNWQGTNWVRAEIEYADKTVRQIYDSIEYYRPVLMLNDGASTTTSQTVTASLSHVGGNAVKMRIAKNGSNYGEWLDVSLVFDVTLPNWIGTNFVNIELLYADGTTISVYDSIDLV
jgi:hypothetical protein